MYLYKYILIFQISNLIFLYNPLLYTALQDSFRKYKKFQFNSRCTISLIKTKLNTEINIFIPFD